MVNKAKELLKQNNIDENLADYLYKYLEDKSKFEESINLLIEGKPVQYIVGNVDFYGYNFIVNENVLIPRFETEELIEKTIKYIKRYLKGNLDIVDLGTGSGCIAITLNKELNCNVDAVDIIPKALDVAKINAKKNNAKVTFYEGNMLEPLNIKYDVIISNPPYIAYDEEIMEIVKNNEPHNALYASDNGLKHYKYILKNAKKYLKEKNIIAFEIGQSQGEAIKKEAKKYFDNIIIEKDLQGKDRFVFIINI